MRSLFQWQLPRRAIKGGGWMFKVVNFKVIYVLSAKFIKQVIKHGRVGARRAVPVKRFK